MSFIATTSSQHARVLFVTRIVAETSVYGRCRIVSSIARALSRILNRALESASLLEQATNYPRRRNDRFAEIVAIATDSVRVRMACANYFGESDH